MRTSTSCSGTTWKNRKTLRTTCVASLHAWTVYLTTTSSTAPHPTWRDARQHGELSGGRKFLYIHGAACDVPLHIGDQGFHYLSNQYLLPIHDVYTNRQSLQLSPYKMPLQVKDPMHLQRPVYNNIRYPRNGIVCII